MRVSDLDYDLDPALVATEPAHPRDSARLMVVDRASGAIVHAAVRDLPRFLRAGDALVVNRTSVLRARVRVRELASGRETEGLLLEPVAAAGTGAAGSARGYASDAAPDARTGAMPDASAGTERETAPATTPATPPATPRAPDVARAGILHSAHAAWRVLLRQAKRFAPGARLALIDHDGRATDDALELVARDGEAWLARLAPGARGGSVADVLERSGHTPLPPYILKARRDAHLEVDDDVDRAEYETVYADRAARGSVAAPTAGLHFTEALLGEIARRGIPTHEVILHVGAGTFKPVEVDDLRAHPMHAEHFRVPRATLAALDALDAPRAAGRARLVAVGTTTVRALESLPAHVAATSTSTGGSSGGGADGVAGSTSILIAPGHRFRHVDALLTNFHLPRSTLLALVGGFMGMELMREAYATAVRERYRFYSYGDAMLVV